MNAHHINARGDSRQSNPPARDREPTDETNTKARAVEQLGRSGHVARSSGWKRTPWVGSPGLKDAACDLSDGFATTFGSKSYNIIQQKYMFSYSNPHIVRAVSCKEEWGDVEATG